MASHATLQFEAVVHQSTDQLEEIVRRAITEIARRDNRSVGDLMTEMLKEAEEDN